MQRRLWRVSALAALTLLAALVMAGCGGAGGTGAGEPSGAASNGTTNPPGTGLTIHPCTGVYKPQGVPVVTLGGSSGQRSATVAPGDIVEVRLDTVHKWSLDTRSLAKTLVPLNTEGAADGAACVWDFKAQAPGTATIMFSGSPVCDPTEMCPQYVTALKFDITVS